MTFIVHEPGPNGDSETALSQKLGRKLSRVHKTPNWPNWAHRSAHARACLALSWSWPLAVSQAQGVVSWALPAPCRGRRRRVAARCAARQAAVSWAVSRYSLASCPLPITIHPSVLRQTFQPSLAASITIQILYRDTTLIPGQATLSLSVL